MYYAQIGYHANGSISLRVPLCYSPSLSDGNSAYTVSVSPQMRAK